MFVNSCLFKVCFVWILAFFFFFFWSLFAICFYFFFFFFSSRVKLNIATDTWADFFFAASSIVKKSLLPHVLKEKKKMGFRVFTSPFNRILVAQKLFTTEALSLSGFEKDRSLKIWMIRPPPFSLLETALTSAYEDCVIPLPLSYLHPPVHYEM